MFEYLRDDLEFRQKTTAERAAQFDLYKQQTLNPLFEQRGVPEDARQRITKKIEQDYASIAYKTEAQAFSDAAKDLVLGVPGRLVTSAQQLGMPIEKGIAEAMTALTGDDEWVQAIAEKEKRLKDAQAFYTFSADAAKWNDTGTVGMATGGLVGGLMHKFSSMVTSQWAQPFLQATAQTVGRAVASSAFSSGVGELAIEATMSNLVTPAIESTDWDPDKKALAVLGSYVVLGLGSGATLEYKIDKAIGSPLFSKTLDGLVEKAKSAPFPNLTASESALRHLVADPTQLQALGRAFKEAEFVPDNIRVEPTEAELAAGNIKLQNMIDRELGQAASVKDLSDPVQAESLAELITRELDNLAAQRAKSIEEPDFHTMKLLDESEEVAEALTGTKIDAVDPQAVVDEPLKFYARVNTENKIVFRASARPSKEVLTQLKEVGLLWQPNKMFNANDPKTKGVYYGPNTPEAHAKVREIFETNGQPVSSKPAKSAEGKRVEAQKTNVETKTAETGSNKFSVSTIDGNTMVRVSIDNEAAVTRLGELGYAYDETIGAFVGKSNIALSTELKKLGLEPETIPVKAQTPEAKGLQKRLQAVEKAKNLPAASQAIPVKSDREVLRDGWRYVDENNKPVVTKLNDKVRSEFRWLPDTDIQTRHPAAYTALKGDLGVRSIKEGFTFDDIMRTTVNEYNRFRPGQLLDPVEIKDHMRKLSELEDMLESGWKNQPRKKASKEELNVAYRQLVDKKLFTPEQFKSITKVLRNFKMLPDFLVDVAPEGRRSFFSFLNNTIYLRRADDFFHETGHWVWLHGLTKQERLQFFENAMVKYGDNESWNALWPGRNEYMKHTYVDPKKYPVATYEGHFQNVTELYADMFRKYVHSYHMPVPETRGVMEKMLKMARAIYKPLLEVGDEIPKDMRRFLEKVVTTPMPRKGKLRLAEMEDLVQSQKLYQDREAFMDVVRAHGEDAEADQFLLSVLTQNDSTIEALTKTGANLENVLNRIYRDVLALHHAEVGDEQMLEKVLGRVREAFEESNKGEMLDALKNAGTGKIQNKYGINTDEGSSMPTVATEAEAKRQFAKSSQATDEHYGRAAELQYRAMKQFFSDLSNLYSASKFYRRNFPKSGPNAAKRADMVAMSQEEWAHLVQRLSDEELMRREPMARLDTEGNLDEFKDRPKRDQTSDDIEAWDDAGEEIFENAAGRYTPEEIRYIQLQAWPQAISFMLGFDTDSENGVPIPFTGVNLNWSIENWIDRGGHYLSTYMMFNKGLRAKSKQFILNRWQSLDPDVKQAAVRKWTAVTKHPAVRIWREGDGLDTGMQKLIRQKRMTDTNVRGKFFDAAEKLNKTLSLDEQRMVAEIITKNGDLDITDASPRVRASAQIVQNLFSGIKQDLLAAGIPEHLVQDFGGNFLPQVFEASAKSWWMQGTEGRRMKNMYESINAKFLAPQGITHTLRSLDAEMQYLMRGIKEHGLKVEPGMVIEEFVDDAGKRLLVPKTDVVQGTPLHTWKVQEYDMKTGKLKINRAYTSLERQMLREETSVVPRLVEFGKQASKLIAQSRLMQNIDQNPNLAIDTKVLVRELGEDGGEQAVRNLQNENWVFVPETESLPGIKRYGALAGKLVHPEAMYVLRNTTSTAPEHPFWNQVFRQYKAGISLWKIGKTAFNVTTHGINFIGNSAMCVMDGRNPLDVLLRGGKAIIEKGELYNKAVEAGMLDSNILKSELGLADFMQRLQKMPNAHPTQGAESAIAGWMQGIMKGTKTLGKNAAYWPMRIYELGDQVYKLGVFAQEFEKGQTAEAALEAANRLFFDYGNVPTGVRAIRDWGVLPFVSYTYKLIPRLADFAVNNPHRMIGLMATLQLANELVMHQEWGDDFEDVQKWQEDVMPDWMNRNVWGTSQRGGIMTGAGKNEFGHEYTEWLDYSQVIPGADLGGVVKGLPFGTNPILSIVAGLANNKDQHLGQQIAPFPDADNIEMKKRNAEARLKFVLRTLLPNLPAYPGAYSLERLGQALTGSGVIDKDVADSFGWTGMDYYGTQEDILPEMLSYMTGIRNRRLYAQQETVRTIEKHKFGIKKEENELRRRLLDKRMSPSEIDSQLNKYKSVTLHNTDQMSRLGLVYRKAQKVLAQRQTEN